MGLFSTSDRNGEIDQQREQYARLKWKLEKKLQELDSELALQKQVVPCLYRVPWGGVLSQIPSVWAMGWGASL